eukprot:CAMPEP_0198201914 /NCGR_PEP_ID=MMETSP1445-20131203/4946_1 /TAXON_ID=36898 /ORGANISM="Pyramimonas sp., Strain CCMP2087" /LENGTH=52 /DNA_ID=CAMNT_0043872569 /DNA_START=48 /DNA_END=202 /DNA_ORIENTATION=-
MNPPTLSMNPPSLSMNSPLDLRLCACGAGGAGGRPAAVPGDVRRPPLSMNPP